MSKNFFSLLNDSDDDGERSTNSGGTDGPIAKKVTKDSGGAAGAGHGVHGAGPGTTAPGASEQAPSASGEAKGTPAAAPATGNSGTSSGASIGGIKLDSRPSWARGGRKGYKEKNRSPGSGESKDGGVPGTGENRAPSGQNSVGSRQNLSELLGSQGEKKKAEDKLAAVFGRAKGEAKRVRWSLEELLGMYRPFKTPAPMKDDIIPAVTCEDCLHPEEPKPFDVSCAKSRSGVECHTYLIRHPVRPTAHCALSHSSSTPCTRPGPNPPKIRTGGAATAAATATMMAWVVQGSSADPGQGAGATRTTKGLWAMATATVVTLQLPPRRAGRCCASDATTARGATLAVATMEQAAEGTA